MFKGISNLASLMKQAQQMGGQIQEMTEELKSKKVTGSAGAGMVEVEVNGLCEVLRVRIDESLTDREMMEDLLPGAINQAVAQAKQLHAEMMQNLTGGLELPGLNDAISQLTGGSDPTKGP